MWHSTAARPYGQRAAAPLHADQHATDGGESVKKNAAMPFGPPARYFLVRAGFGRGTTGGLLLSSLSSPFTSSMNWLMSLNCR